MRRRLHRTTVNVTGDAVGVAVVDQLLQKRAGRTGPISEVEVTTDAV